MATEIRSTWQAWSCVVSYFELVVRKKKMLFRLSLLAEFFQVQGEATRQTVILAGPRSMLICIRPIKKGTWIMQNLGPRHLVQFISLHCQMPMQTRHTRSVVFEVAWQSHKSFCPWLSYFPSRSTPIKVERYLFQCNLCIGSLPI